MRGGSAFSQSSDKGKEKEEGGKTGPGGHPKEAITIPIEVWQSQRAFVHGCASSERTDGAVLLTNFFSRGRAGTTTTKIHHHTTCEGRSAAKHPDPSQCDSCHDEERHGVH